MRNRGEPTARKRNNVCPEPDGAEEIPGTDESAHDIMIRETGQCPWCHEEEDA